MPRFRKRPEQRERIVDWFGPSDFRAALDAHRNLASREYHG